ncbi:SDR family NAD(P)-dependent oxidoreductase [Paenibacillus sp. HJL G12]|uniref:SDR family NAD(P)-dependent oxidoreductase n=1 Tax=Paenibacillus dendrobii TaxID=2691084 RepID=A0A7X3IKI4_9BACL|nr:SDR family NAD(P)-dependent oxidoreductase [Paenibacillus dendrobii]MWV45370.1 SDR family NAD(P)-dependent oxidoreductase [Paenibacillus dendrobii]
MKDFLQYVLTEVKNKRVDKEDAIAWIEQFQTSGTAQEKCDLHPLLHENTSDLSEQRFSSVFSGDEFFLRDHVVNGQAVLPGAVYLEMARAALGLATTGRDSASAGVRLTHIVWVRPLSVGDRAIRVHIGLYPESNGQIAFEIYSETPTPEGALEFVVHCQGVAELSSSVEPAQVLELPALRDACQEHVLSSAECYEQFHDIGLHYGPAHQGIEEVYTGKGQVLAKLVRPAPSGNTDSLYILHPGFIDSVFQATAGLAAGNSVLTQALPFALETLDILGELSSEMWAWIRPSRSNGDSPLQKLDIDVTDGQGNIALRLHGFTTRSSHNRDTHIEKVTDPENVMFRSDELQGQDIQNEAIDHGPRDYGSESDYILEENAVHYFKKLLSSVIHLPVNRINADAPLEKYGIDSVMVLQMTNDLERVFGPLSKTLFFEYQSIQEVTDFFLQSYRESLKLLLGIDDNKAEIEGPAIAPQAAPQESEALVRPRRERPRFLSSGDGALETDHRNARDQKPSMDIAIIGLSGRYPGADNVEHYWSNLKEGKDCITEIPQERWDYQLYYDLDKNKSGKTNSKWGGFLQGVDQFDPLFFQISPREAEIMDPQERLFLQCVYGSMEDAGYTREALGKHGGQVGVYVGVMYEEYQMYGAEQTLLGNPLSLGGSPSSIANRISYWCNFHGPSMAVDTMCSSSLTAIHLACQSLAREGCELAIAGGVNVSVHPNKYLALGQGNFVSSKGRCESFGEGGDGYVPGEGVGAVLLKPLSKAIADGDQIYGVIKGTAVNHGGKTNGYTVPNPQSQADVIGRALNEAGIDPRTISYVEAHGTGTSLGDPIEITGLTKAFQAYTQDQQYCAIGSAKSNIGHCESAAGIAGLTKVLLQMKYGQIAPSLHARTLNPNIDFSTTPFTVQQELTDWERPLIQVNGGLKEFPRRAGLSSFGAGGSNAHVVIEEYRPLPAASEVVVTPQRPAIILLSAKNEERLLAQAEQILAVIRRKERAETDLMDIAYTLQVGREAMEERLGFLVSSLKELEEHLSSFVQHQDSGLRMYRGQVKRNEDSLAVFAADEDMVQAIDAWIAKGKYAKLLDLWVKGLVFDWNRLYSGGRPRRISLPTYPFAKERYWVPQKTAESVRGTRMIDTAIHPLVHRNTSDFAGQRFSTTFTGQEFFLRDHLVQGKRILPGAAHLEMVRAAIALALEYRGDERIGIRLNHVAWVRPIVVEEEAIQVHTELYLEEDGVITFDICGESELDDAELMVYSQGSAVLSPVEESPLTLNLDELREGCVERVFEAESCYAAFEQMGAAYGPAQRGIETIYAGADQVLAKLSLPVVVRDTLSDYMLHPAIVDAAFQATIGLKLGTGEIRSALPFALEELVLYGPCTAEMWAHIRRSPGSGSGDPVQKLDIQICDTEGNVRLRMRGFTSRQAEIGTGVMPVASHAQPLEPSEVLMLTPTWKEVPAAATSTAPEFVEHVVLLCGLAHVSPEAVEGELGEAARCINLQSRVENAGECYVDHVIQVFHEVQRILKSKPKGNVLLQIVAPFDREYQLTRGIAALLKTAAQENPLFHGQWLEIDMHDNAASIAQKLQENMRIPHDREVRYIESKRHIIGWDDVVSEKGQFSSVGPWRDRGIYLITGGAGGLGAIFAEEIATKSRDVTLILTGRSSLSEEKCAELETKLAPGTKLIYKQTDVTDKQQAQDLVANLQQEFGTLNGIIHSAGIVKDGFIFKKTESDVRQVLAPKVKGVLHLDEASANVPLDFFIFFSSGSGVLGNVGQADYAAGNAFMDMYAFYRNDLVTAGQRSGRTLSVNWPLWQEGGMHVDASTEKRMQQATGMLPLRTTVGIQALYKAMTSGKAQVFVAEGDTSRMEQTWFPGRHRPPAIHLVRDKLLQSVAALLNVNATDLDLHAGWEEFGFDAMTWAELTDTLNGIYGLEFKPSELMAQDNLSSLSDYVVRQVGVGTGKPETRREVHAPPEVGLNKPSTHASESELQHQATEYFKKEISSVLKLPVHRIDASMPLETYGIDSVTILQLTTEFEKTFGPLPKTLFFEYQNIREVTSYFLEGYGDIIQQLLGYKGKADTTAVSDKGSVREKTAATLPLSTQARKRSRAMRTVQKQPEQEASKGLDIAIIGLSGRYPGARNIGQFWDALKNGKDCITEIPKERWDHRLYFDADQDKPGKTYSKWGGFLDGVDEFDPKFFNISPREAISIDPQERLFLECVFEAMEDAGYTRDMLARISDHSGESSPGGNVGVYVGVMYEEYQLYGLQEQMQGKHVAIVGNSSSIANRVSYYCNFHGPSLALNTMCSSSLTTIHLASQSLSRGECDVAIAGGVNVSIHPNKYLALGQGKFISDKGRCESFGEGGNGYVPGEGVGAVLLKPLSKAQADGDHIYGVIKGSAINHGGKTNGYTVPNPSAQSDVIKKAYELAGVDPRTVSYIEAHGTGTSLGDPIEIAGLTKAFHEYSKDNQYCAIGSAKSNIGHCESAAGIAGITKILLQFKHKQIAPSLHSKVLNPHIDFTQTPFIVQQQLAEWKRPVLGGSEVPRRAGISSFGAGGSNAHLVLEEYVPKTDERTSERDVAPDNPVLIVWSSKQAENLKVQAQQLLEAIQDEQLTDADLARIAYTLQTGREALEERAAVIVSSILELSEKLRAFATGDEYVSNLYRGQVKSSKDALSLFTMDDELQEAIEKWLIRGKFTKLAELWVKGVDMDWSPLYSEHKPRRISLPTYPFARERYWIVKPEKTDTPLSETASTAKQGTVFPRSQEDLEQVSPELENTVISEQVSAVKRKLDIQPTFSMREEPTAPTKIVLKALGDMEPIGLTEASSSGIQSLPQAEAPQRTMISNIQLEGELAVGLADILYMQVGDIDADTPFIDLGLDSVVGVEWIKLLNKQYGVTLAATKIYDYPNLHEFALFLSQQLVQVESDDEVSEGALDVVDSKPIQSIKLQALDALVTDAVQQDKPNEWLAVESIPVLKPNDSAALPDLTGSGLKAAAVPSQVLIDELAASLAEVLYMNPEEVEVDQNFIEMGLDSVVGVEWVKLLNKRYGTSIAATKIYDYTNVRELAGYVLLQMPEPEPAAVPEIKPKPGQRQEELGESYGLVLSTVHSIDEISLCPWAVANPSEAEVQIRVKASAVNFPDVMCVQGLYPTMPAYPFVPGFEVAGVISSIGAGVTDFRVGDEVIALTAGQMGGHASHVNVPVANMVRKPANISFEEACSLPIVFGTVAHALNVGRYMPGDHILIQTATGGCGLIAIQLANLQGCVCYGTSSKADKLDILKQLDVPYAINYKEGDFDQEVRRLSNNRGVDIVLNTLSGEAIQKGLNCLAPSGRYLELAVHALKTSHKLDLSKLLQNQSIHSIDLRRLGLEGGVDARKILNTMVEMIESEQIVPIVSRIYPIGQIQEALDYVGKGQHIGKVVISHTSREMVDLTEHCIQRLQEQKRRCEQRSKDIPQEPVALISNIVNSPQADPLLEGVAVIGMSGQFPQADSLADLWNNLALGKDCVSEVPATRWPIHEYYDENPDTPGKTYSKWMGVLEGADQFDPLFFNISPAEAELMDPQQRLFLKNSWHCIEDAGISPSSLSGSRCGVFVGCAGNEYGQMAQEQGLSAQGLMGEATSILSGRISYFLNLKGPSIAIETACSSSLVAIAEACNSLVLHHCDSALAGGVYITAGPSMHIKTSKSGMLSKDGRCFTFDTRANGFVPGEGVGVLLLKRLSDAVRDEDPIYGVIRGWGVNQDGKTNGITAPSVNSQIMLEKEVYERFHIHPETITLVEAHGTGTKLGDPIEVEALTESFRAFTDKTSYCALGSVKSNLGHLMMAAGVTGVMKVLLAMKHEQIPPLVHFEKLNEHIQLANSPFYLNTELTPWVPHTAGPRRASVSSFGFSGTNAHLVVEEYVPAHHAVRPMTNQPDCGVLFVLSAKSKSQLEVYALRMARFLTSTEDLQLADIAYTLQEGRDAMNFRLAFVASSQEDAVQALKAFSEGTPREALHSGRVHKRRSPADIQSGSEAVRAGLANLRLDEVARWWVQGADVDWSQLYPGNKPKRIHMEGYPFADKRYWIPEVEIQTGTNPDQATARETLIHPLVHRNTSNFTEHRYSSTFTGNEFFLADHQVNGCRVLPGTAYLEMARAAIMSSLDMKDTPEIMLSDVIWLRPLTVKEHPVEVHIRLLPEDNGQISYEIYTEDEHEHEGQLKLITHAQGNARVQVKSSSTAVNLEDLQKECSLSILSSAECYAKFSAMGLDYGPGHRCIDYISVGANQVLAKLSLPASLTHTSTHFGLHPGLLDSALQASMGLLSDGNSSYTMLPFSVQHTEIVGTCSSNMWASVRFAEGNRRGQDRQILDIDLYDEHGQLCVRMTGLSLRRLERESSIAIEETELMLFKPHWEMQAVGEQDSLSYTKHLVMLVELDAEHRDQVAAQLTSARCVPLEASAELDIAERFHCYAEQALLEIQTMLSEKPKGNVLIQIVVPSDGERSLFAGLAGLLKTVRLEHPKCYGQLIETDEIVVSELVRKLRDESRNPIEQVVRYTNNERCIVNWRELEVSRDEIRIPWKEQGVYLLTGGAGSLGLIFAREIISQVSNVTLILTGRSPLTVNQQEQIEQLKSHGAQVVYEQVDVSDKEAIFTCTERVVAQHGRLNGILHGAGIHSDSFLMTKTKEELHSVLDPKVNGLVYLDQATQGIRLDFFILFSSLAGSLGNPGQADYAAANAFMDSFASYRNALVMRNERYGQTISINWPLWQEGGMQMDEATSRLRMERVGMVSMQTEKGIRALYQIASAGAGQAMVMEGNVAQLRASITADQRPAKSMKRNAVVDSNESVLFDDAFFLNLTQQISNGELSEKQLIEILNVRQ